VAVAYAATHALLVGVPPFFGPEHTLTAEEALFWAVLLAALPALVATARPGALRTLGLGALTALLVAAVLRAKLRHAWEGAEIALGLALAAAACVAVAGGAGSLAEKRPGPRATFALGAAGLGLAVASPLSGSVFLGQLAGGVTAALGCAFAIGCWRPSRALGPAGLVLAGGALFGVGTSAYCYNELPALAALLLVCVPVVARVVLAGPVATRTGLLARAAVVLAPAAAAVLLAWRAFEPSPY
jgi:hypothetical protein